METKRKIYLIVVLAIVLISAMYFFGLKSKPAIQAFGFEGIVEKVEGNSIFIQGRYVISSSKPSSPEPKLLEVTNADSLEYKRIGLFIPSEEELAKTDNEFNLSELKREESPGSFQGLREGMRVHLKSDKNIYGKTRVKMASISYEEWIYPD